MRSDESPNTHRSPDMPLITPPATPSSFDESVQPQAFSHGESADTPVSSSSNTRNEANVEGGANQHSSSNSLHSRSDELTEREISSIEDMMLYVRSWCNYCRYCDVQKCVRNYCGRVWTEFSSFVGLQVGSNTATAVTESNL